MGSYAECWVGEFYVGSTRNEVDFSLVQLFRVAEKKIVISNKANVPNKRSVWVEDIEENEEINVVFYSAPVKIIKDRLELLGYSLANSQKAYECYLEGEISRYEELSFSENGYIWQNTLNILREMDLNKWLSTLKEIYDKGLVYEKYSRENENRSLLSYMLQEDWYGFPHANIDLNLVLRLLFEVMQDNENCIYDITGLILSEYCNVDEDIHEYAANTSSQEYFNNGKCIILTEGKSDALILSESLNLLYPHLSDYFTFMDFEGAKVGGGAGSLANMVKSFSGAGIINRVVAVFDNDTAAHAALKKLKKTKVSRNIKIFTLPDIDILKDYPTIGPSGMVSMNVNGLAGSIEPYLGQECLLDSKGEYYPIQWTGLDAGLQKYQGEITAKDVVQKNFKEKLKFCIEDNSSIDDFDWSGVKAILDGIFKLFHEDDGQQIISWAQEHS